MTNRYNNDTCNRCSAPLTSSHEGQEYHPKCRMIEEMDDTSCSNCGNSDTSFNLMDGNLIQYCSDCEAVECNPHE